MSAITWDQANFLWNSNKFTWEDVKIITATTEEDWKQWNKNKKDKLVKLILKIHGNTITESKKREIKQYKIKAKDIRLVVKEVLGTEMIAENVSF